LNVPTTTGVPVTLSVGAAIDSPVGSGAVSSTSTRSGGKVKVVKIDADENQNLVMQYGVMGIPTLLFMKGGEVKERVTGYLPKEKLIAKFSPHFN
jgi:thioredoxin-like negative regulator of GroEL